MHLLSSPLALPRGNPFSAESFCVSLPHGFISRKKPFCVKCRRSSPGGLQQQRAPEPHEGASPFRSQSTEGPASRSSVLLPEPWKRESLVLAMGICFDVLFWVLPFRFRSDGEGFRWALHIQGEGCAHCGAEASGVHPSGCKLA